jgi:hypothetical protein
LFKFRKKNPKNSYFTFGLLIKMGLVSRNFFKKFLKGVYFIFGIEPPFLGKHLYNIPDTGGSPGAGGQQGNG